MYLRQLANGIFQRMGEFQLHLLCGGPGVSGDNHRILANEGRIFQAPQVEKRQDASCHQQNKHHPADGAMAYRVLGNVHGELLPRVLLFDVDGLPGTQA